MLYICIYIANSSCSGGTPLGRHRSTYAAATAMTRRTFRRFVFVYDDGVVNQRRRSSIESTVHRDDGDDESYVSRRLTKR